MTTVLYGGAFDPVHVGHVFIGREALRVLAPCQLMLIPTGVPNPVFCKELQAPDEDRLAMLKLAFTGITGVSINDIELRRVPRASYFVDTLEDLLPALQANKLVLLLGEDQLASFHLWHRYEEILRYVELRYVPRVSRQTSGHHLVQAEKLFDTNPFDGLSSSLIRNRIANDLPVYGLVPEVVAAYIARHSLYRQS